MWPKTKRQRYVTEEAGKQNTQHNSDKERFYSHGPNTSMAGRPRTESKGKNITH